MAWELNLPGSVKRGVDVNVRRHPSGGVIVLVRLWPDICSRLGWAQGDAVAVLEGGGADAGKLMLQRADNPQAVHVRRLGAPGTSEGAGSGAGHLCVAVHWPAYAHPFPPRTAMYELPDGELAGALIVHMPDPPPPDDAGAAARAPGAGPGNLPPARAGGQAKAKTKAGADAGAGEDPQRPAAATAAPARDLSVVIAIAAGRKGDTRACLEALVQCPEVGPDEFARVLGPRARNPSGGTVTSAVFQARAALQGSGWSIEATGAGRYRLTAGEDPAAARRSSASRLRASRAGQDCKPAPDPDPAAAPPRPRTKLEAAAAGTCKYMIVEAGKARPCGGPARGNYCEAHKVMTLPVGGFASGAGAQVFAGRRK